MNANSDEVWLDAVASAVASVKDQISATDVLMNADDFEFTKKSLSRRNHSEFHKLYEDCSLGWRICGLRVWSKLDVPARTLSVVAAIGVPQNGRPHYHNRLDAVIHLDP